MHRTTKTPPSKSKSNPRTGSHSKKTTGNRKATRTHSTNRTTRVHKTLNEKIYSYECTRPGCNYRIVRDEKAEQNQLRYDLKCPKCHHQEFRCLGEGDLTQEMHNAPMVELDFGAFKTIGLGVN